MAKQALKAKASPQGTHRMKDGHMMSDAEMQQMRLDKRYPTMKKRKK